MKRIILLILVTVVFTTSCEKWLDINHDPNNARTVDVTSGHLLTAAEANIAQMLANSSNACFLAQHLTKSGTVSGTFTYLSGLIMPQNQDDWWLVNYSINSDLVKVIEKAEEDEEYGLRGIATILLVHNYQRNVDMFGNIPYSEANKMAEEYNTGNISPAYDKAEDIYKDLLKRLDQAILDLEKGISAGAKKRLASADIIFGANEAQWLKLGYSMKLRLLMRVSGVSSVVNESELKAQLAALEGKTLNIGENATVNPGYYYATNKMRPFFRIFGFSQTGSVTSSQNYYRPTSAFVDRLRDNNDPRLRVYVNPRSNLADHEGYAHYSQFGLGNERYIGIPYGQQAPATNNYTSAIGRGILAFGNNIADGAGHDAGFLMGAETGFLLAEAALKGYIPGGDAKAKEYYEEAVISAFNWVEQPLQDAALNAATGRPAITGSAAEAAREYLDQDSAFMNWDKMTTDKEKMSAIATQKWIVLFGVNPIEAWSEQRRLDLPALNRSVQANGLTLISKLPYPQTERAYNAENVAAQGEVNVYTSRLFWDLANDPVPVTEIYL